MGERERGKRGREEMLAGGETGKGFRGGDRPGMGSESEDSYPERLGGGGNQGCLVTCAPESAPPPKYLVLPALWLH